MGGLSRVLDLITTVDLLVATAAVAVSLWLAYVAGWRPSWLAVWRRDQRRKWVGGGKDAECAYCGRHFDPSHPASRTAYVGGGTVVVCDSLCYRAAVRRDDLERRQARRREDLDYGA